MRIVTCIVHDHNLWFVAMAALMCVTGSLVSVTLFRRTMAETGLARVYWCFMSAMTAGAATWATHFIAMLGYQTDAPVDLDSVLTVVSALIATAGIGFGLVFASLNNRRLAIVAGGATMGLAVAAMHYVGMFAYRVEGIVHWDWRYIAASLVITVAGGMLAVRRLRTGGERLMIVQAGALLSLTIVGLHFADMAAFSVTPLPGISHVDDSEIFTGMAAAIGMVALLIVGTGMSTYVIERKTSSESEDRIAHIAMHDSLTDLANRHQFTDLLEAECDKLKRYGRPFSLLMVDLDRFKPINDTLGHPIGDAVLQRVANRLCVAVRSGDVVARLGGDEFAILGFGIRDSGTAASQAARIVEILSRPMIVNGHVIELSGSVGFAVAPEHGSDPENLIQHADIALYSAKRDGKRTFRMFEASLMEDIRRRRSLEAALRQACMRDEFTIAYQPVFSSASGEISGAEALVRWTCAERGPVSPVEFIPVAEELGLVSRIGADVLRRACKDAASWPGGLDLAVNVSPVQLLDPRLPQTVARALEDSGLQPERLELEITETALLNNDEAALRTLTQIQELGVRISLDDFGTGYSSLSYLHRFPISRIKIDKSFVQRLPDDLGSASIVRAIAQLGESLSMKITAEGIETDGQLTFIREQGCDHVQGFLTGHPIPAEAFADLVARAARVAAS
ncbi:putative bifunctional diguanylate cyclase/phosphodiesterase [Aurantiacibacter spongiae]|uniref:EAL domain-containing protein n=1 Tax=Aurantiacibacter spongiae TaxID=2488860 RepID=A0A3N5DSX3_9SPHN|nr:EAL domain-containing protein [Aurantiacibacter spongiae]RPF72391.1 EAL domain-containing protein [Aurantiacibacter spongiae]